MPVAGGARGFAVKSGCNEMRLFAAAIMLAGFALAGGAHAQTYSPDYPVCIQVYAPLQFIDCRYTSIPQCQASASGRAAMCQINPFYVGEPAPSRRRRHR